MIRAVPRFGEETYEGTRRGLIGIDDRRRTVESEHGV